MKRNCTGDNRPARVALFGGTFNPIHHGHCQVALDVLQRFDLDCIYFIPSARPPHKPKGRLATSAQRLEMVQLALEQYPGLKACDVEIRRGGSSYTIDTARHFKALQPAGGQLFFMLGVDAFLEIETWKDFAQLFDLVAFIVMSRPGQGLPALKALGQAVAGHARAHLSREYCPAGDGDALIHPSKRPIYWATVTAVDIASSQIRRMIREGTTVRPWLAPAVADYIEERGLYR